MGSICQSKFPCHTPSLNFIEPEGDLRIRVRSFDAPRINNLTNTQQPNYLSEEDLDLEVYEPPKQTQTKEFEFSISSDFKGNGQLGQHKVMKFSDMIQQQRQEALNEHQKYLSMQNQTFRNSSKDKGELDEKNTYPSKQTSKSTHSHFYDKNNQLNPKLDFSQVSENSKEASQNDSRGLKKAESSFSFGPHRYQQPCAPVQPTKIEQFEQKDQQISPQS